MTTSRILAPDYAPTQQFAMDRFKGLVIISRRLRLLWPLARLSLLVGQHLQSLKVAKAAK